MYYGQIGNMDSESIGAKIRIPQLVFFEKVYRFLPVKFFDPPQSSRWQNFFLHFNSVWGRFFPSNSRKLCDSEKKSEISRPTA